jgi:hypothetical protein
MTDQEDKGHPPFCSELSTRGVRHVMLSDKLLFCRCGWMLLSRYSILWAQDLVFTCPTPVTTPSTTTAYGKYSDVSRFEEALANTIPVRLWHTWGCAMPKQFLSDFGTLGVLPY